MQNAPIVLLYLATPLEILGFVLSYPTGNIVRTEECTYCTAVLCYPTESLLSEMHNVTRTLTMYHKLLQGQGLIC